MMVTDYLDQDRTDVWAYVLRYIRTCDRGRPDTYFLRQAYQLSQTRPELRQEFTDEVWARCNLWAFHATNHARIR